MLGHHGQFGRNAPGLHSRQQSNSSNSYHRRFFATQPRTCCATLLRQENIVALSVALVSAAQEGFLSAAEGGLSLPLKL